MVHEWICTAPDITELVHQVGYVLEANLYQMQQEKIDKLSQHAGVLSVCCNQHTLGMPVLVCKTDTWPKDRQLS